MKSLRKITGSGIALTIGILSILSASLESGTNGSTATTSSNFAFGTIATFGALAYIARRRLNKETSGKWRTLEIVSIIIVLYFSYLGIASGAWYVHPVTFVIAPIWTAIAYATALRGGKKDIETARPENKQSDWWGKLKNRDEWGVYGPFTADDDPGELWHYAKEQELKDYLEKAKQDSKNPANSKKDRLIYEKDAKMWAQELKNLQDFVENHTRCLERFKFDKDVLQKVHEDWVEYNMTLFGSHSHMEADLIRMEPLDLDRIQKQGRYTRIKLEEIEKRMKDRLSI